MLKMKGKRLAAIMACFSLLACVGVTSASAEWQWLTDWEDIPYGETSQVQSTIPAEEETWSYDKSRMAFDLQNKEREKVGKEPLAWSDDLYRLACARAKEMATSQQVTHERPGDHLPLWESQPYGLGWIAENALLGSNTPENAIASWIESDAHKAALLEERYLSGAIACYGRYWSSLFSLEESPKATSEIVIQNADGTTTPLPDDIVLFQQVESATASSSTASK